MQWPLGLNYRSTMENQSFRWYAAPAVQARIKFALDLVMWTSVTVLAFVIRLETGWLDFVTEIYVLLLVGIPFKAGLIAVYGLHQRSWRKMGVRDLYALAQVTAIVSAVYLIIAFAAGAWLTIPKSILLLEPALAILGLGSMRLVARSVFESRGRNGVHRHGRIQRVLIVGAGEAGTIMAREMLRQPSGGLLPVGYLDDDLMKQKRSFVGVRVLGTIADLPSVVEEQSVDEILIAMPSESGACHRQVVDLARNASVRYRTIPAIVDILSGKVAISQIREVEFEDLLGRSPVRLEMDTIGRYLAGKTVLVTGAGGSIGSEIVRQLVAFNPRRVLLLGRGENSIFEAEREFLRRFPSVEFVPVITDVRDYARLAWLFDTFRPQVVFHAAAHKHVPLMECNADQAIANNVGGTRNLVELGLRYGVERFVNVSTDKAVNPTSVMGASKRMAEMIVQSAAERAGENGVFVSVRFGNVLGSRGSVIPQFKEQIRRGGPVSVTHPDMVRYFMTIPEASQLVLQAGGLGENGSVYVLDMGEPVRIVDLARDLIRLSGFEPDVDIAIEFSGIRPGEKLFEELLTAEEGTVASRHEKIFRARQTCPDAESLAISFERVFAAANARDPMQIRLALKAAVPSCNFASMPVRADASGDATPDVALESIGLSN
jgi:FlaA1/EpsC-like NDP-sugar epimerase